MPRAKRRCLFRPQAWHRRRRTSPRDCRCCPPLRRPWNGAMPISRPRCRRCAARSKPTGSALLRTCLRSATAAPAKTARRSRSCVIRTGSAPISKRRRSIERRPLSGGLGESGRARVAEASPPQAQANVPARKLVNIDFPTAASIPPVSIMNPSRPARCCLALPLRGRQSESRRQPQRQRARRARRQPNPPAQTAAQTPPATTGTVEPIWPEPVPPVPARPAPAGAPVQLSPPQPGASAGRRPRTR